MDDIKFMRRALELAQMAEGDTSPNPMVGAVIVDGDGNIVGEGYHHKAGQPHAEINALAAAGEKAKGATVYVTLEPCSHYRRLTLWQRQAIRQKTRRFTLRWSRVPITAEPARAAKR